MQVTNSSSRYGAVSQLLHWITVALVIILLTMGMSGDIEADKPGNAFFWHGSLGILVLLLTVIRVIWSLASPLPLLPQTRPRGARILTRTVHVSLYLLLLALPVSGWLAASAEGASANFFGIVSLPRWDPASKAGT